MEKTKKVCCIDGLNINSKKSFYLFVLIISMGFSGCMVGPKYTKPTVETPDGWATLQNPMIDDKPGVPIGIRGSKQVDLVSWWDCFNDPMLGELIEKAVDSNHDLRLAEARLREVRAAYGVSKAALYPQLKGSAGYKRQHESENGPYGYLSDLDYNEYRVGFDASWEIDLWGRARHEKQAKKAEEGAALEDLRNVLVSVIGEVSCSYIELRGFQRRVALIEKNMATVQKRLMLTEKRFQAGLASEVEVNEVSANLAGLTAEIPVLEGEVRQRIHAISTLLGELPGKYVERLSLEKPLPDLPADVEVGLPVELLDRRPDIREAERRLAAATERVGVAKADLLPRLSLSALFAYEALDFDRITDSDSRASSFGPSFILPIFNAGRIRSNINVKTAQQEQALIKYEKAVLAAYKEVEDNLATYSAQQRRHEKLYRRVRKLQSTADLSQELYDKGKFNLLEVLEAQRTLLVAQDELVQNEISLSVQLVSLYKALGGGWVSGSKKTAL